MEAVFLKLLNMSISAGWVVLAVVILRIVLKRMPKAIMCFLWGLVAFRLICPFTVESVLSLIPSAETVPQNIMYMQEPAIHTGLVFFNSAVNPVLSESFAPAAGDSVNSLQVITSLATVVWIAGMIVMALYALISWLRIRRKAAVSLVLQDNIYLCDYIDTPFILGIIRPKIYIPSALEKEKLSYVIDHEKAHLIRRDHWWKPLGFLLLSVYWFHPLLWLGYIFLCKDLELACDEKVIRTLGEADRKGYSDTLLSCSISRRRLTACPLAFGEVGVKERVRNVLYYKKPAFWIVAAGVVVCIAVAVCFLTNPKESPNSGNDLAVVPGDLPVQEWYPPVQENLGKDGVIYVSNACLYLNPLSSAMAGGDSGDTYVFREDAFVIADSSSGQIREELSTDWAWEDFPFTDEEWSAFFVPGGFGSIRNLSERYENIPYLKLSEKYRLLAPDGELWLVQMSHTPQVGSYIWTVYTLVTQESMGVAVWEYSPFLSSRYPAFPIAFDLGDVEISAFCDTGMLIDYDNPEGYVEDALITIPAGRRLYWSPLNADGTVLYAGQAKITLHIQRGNLSEIASIYITSDSSENPTRVYTARLVGGNMVMQQKEEMYGAVISLRSSE